MDNVIFKKVKSLKANHEDLARYLYDIVVSYTMYNPEMKDVLISLIPEYEDFLFNSNYWLAQDVALYALLFKLKIKNDKYLNKAVEILTHTDIDIDVRKRAGSSLAVAYFGTKNRLLLNIFLDIKENETEPEMFRYMCLRDMLGVWGITALEVSNKAIVPMHEDGNHLDNDKAFINDINEIKAFLNGKKST